MYPFERFTDGGKKVLTLAQEEAERRHHSYIGTEHLLIGLLREGDGVAARALAALGIELGPVREQIEKVLGRNERIIIQQIIPTSRVKTVIEIAFEESRRASVNYVGTEHMLVALMLEGEGVAAHVVEDLGAPLGKVWAEVRRLEGAIAEKPDLTVRSRYAGRARPSPRFRISPSTASDYAVQVARLDEHIALAALAVLMRRFQVRLQPPAALLDLLDEPISEAREPELRVALERWRDQLRGDAPSSAP